jgi:class 3 adenylate cyclase
MSLSSTIPQARTYEPLVIAFTDVGGYSRAAAGRDDQELAEFADELYGATDRCVRESGGREVKHLGDGSLLVWPASSADSAARALLALREEVNAILRKRGWQAELVVRVHVGEVVAGPFGASGGYDIIGHAAMTAARLEARTISFSQAAFRALSPETRALLKKHTPPLVYVPARDPRP